jgi:cytochrome c
MPAIRSVVGQTIVVCGLLTLALLSTLALSAAGPPSGADLFNSKCTGCHALETSKVGPPLKGIYGKPAAQASGFPYSESLKKAHLTWDGPTLDKWLTDPTAIAPDTDMSIRMDSASERAAIIDYLKTLSR